MNRFPVAHINEQSVNLVIVPLDPSFGRKTQDEQATTTAALQFASASAGLAGQVVPVWEENGRFAFFAPRNFHAFFASIDMLYVQMRLNRELEIR